MYALVPLKNVPDSAGSARCRNLYHPRRPDGSRSSLAILVRTSERRICHTLSKKRTSSCETSRVSAAALDCPSRYWDRYNYTRLAPTALGTCLLRVSPWRADGQAATKLERISGDAFAGLSEGKEGCFN